MNALNAGRVIFSRNSSLIHISKCMVHPRASKRLGPLTWKRFGSAIAFISIPFAGFIYYKNMKEREMIRYTRRSLGKAAIGGPFELIDLNGKMVSSKDFLGQWLLIYFGFTHCPDVCPEEIEKMCAIVDKLESQNKSVKPLFISVDPERDTPEAVKNYLKEFSSKLMGLTGTPEQVESVTKAYRIYYSKGPKDEFNDYLVDHSIVIYLVNPKGEFVDYYSQTRKIKEVVDAIVTNMNSYEILQKRSWI